MKKVKICKDTKTINILSNEKSNNTQLDYLVTLNNITNYFKLCRVQNTVFVSHEIYENYKSESLIILDSITGKYLSVVLEEDLELEGKNCRLTSYISNDLSIPEDRELILCKNKSINFKRVLIQTLDKIRDDEIVLPAKSIENFFAFTNFEYYEIYNTQTSCRVVIKRKHIKFDNNLSNDTVRLNRKQRIFLGLEVPEHIKSKKWKELLINMKENFDEIDFMQKMYPTEDHFLLDQATYSEKVQINAILAKYLPSTIRISPVIESFNNKSNISLMRRISNFFVGKSVASLQCKRPYENDENAYIVRMTETNMHTLGVETMDYVILHYKYRKVKCRVLPYSDKKKDFLKTNTPCSIDLSIGVPAIVRKELGVPDLASVIKIERDTAFIMKKNLNQQIVPVVTSLLSINLLSKSYILSLILSVLAIPIVMYINLSSKRNMRI